MEVRSNMKITEKEFNVQTGEETITERDETATETQARLQHEAKVAAQQAEAEAREAQRQVILDRLGLTADEARLLLGS
jgi:H2-forming N5,N10-methylenetetrahydromethanopterin dehydrogenase-like enzyme